MFAMALPLLEASTYASGRGKVGALAHWASSGAKIGRSAHWAVAVAPVLVVVFGVLGGMHLDASDAPSVVAARAAHGFFGRLYWIETFANADSAKVNLNFWVNPDLEGAA